MHMPAYMLKWIIDLAGSVLSGGGSTPSPMATAKTWTKAINNMQKAALSTRLGIPIIYGIDAVHGHNNVYKATIFPHNVGLGVTRFELICWHKVIQRKTKNYISWILNMNKVYKLKGLFFILIGDPYLFWIFTNVNFYLCKRDPNLLKRIGQATALEARATGIPYVFAPCVAVTSAYNFLNFDLHY